MHSYTLDLHLVKVKMLCGQPPSTIAAERVSLPVGRQYVLNIVMQKLS